MKKDKYLTITIVALCIAVVVMSVGYALFATNLTITGNVDVKKSVWDIKFDTTSFKETTGGKAVAASPAPTIEATTVVYNVTLTKPGDFHEFTIDVKNGGTFDAVLKKITMDGLSLEQKNYIKWTVTYNLNDYTETTTLNPGQQVTLLPAGTDAIKVKVEYIQPGDPSQLPSTDQKLNLVATLNYEQKQ